jgi:hypothetical protein
MSVGRVAGMSLRLACRQPTEVLRLLDVLLLAAMTTKPAVGVAGFGPDWTGG